MRIALFQGPEQPGTVTGNLERLRQAAGAAAVRGARLLVCPEMFLTGYHIGPEATRRLAEPADGPSARQAAAIARASGLALLYGYPELAPDGSVFNAALLVGPPNGYSTGTRLAELDRQIVNAVSENARIRTTADFREGVSSFLEKREPKWAGE